MQQPLTYCLILNTTTMTVTDLYGTELTVTDLEKAIANTALYKGFKHRNATAAQSVTDNELRAYWTDMHEKLLQLQTKLMKQ